MREALQLLADQRLIDIVPGRESRVSPIDPRQVKSNYLLMGKLNAVALELGQDRLDGGALSRLAQIDQEMREALRRGDYPGVRRLDRAFHFVFFDLADNYFLLNTAQNLYTHCLRIENLYFSQENDFSASLVLHGEILCALREGRYEQAGRLLTQNWTDTVRDM